MNKYLTIENAIDAITKYNPNYSPTVFRSVFERYGKFEDVEPVRHGHWTFNANNGRPYAHCSACDSKMSPTLYGYAHCPYCGAKMDGKENKE